MPRFVTYDDPEWAALVASGSDLMNRAGDINTIYTNTDELVLASLTASSSASRHLANPVIVGSGTSLYRLDAQVTSGTATLVSHPWSVRPTFVSLGIMGDVSGVLEARSTWSFGTDWTSTLYYVYTVYGWAPTSSIEVYQGPRFRIFVPGGSVYQAQDLLAADQGVTSDAFGMVSSGTFAALVIFSELQYSRTGSWNWSVPFNDTSWDRYGPMAGTITMIE